MSAIIEASPVAPTTTVPLMPKGESCILVIFGASGDLTRRKLIPALYDLARMGCMNPTKWYHRGSAAASYLGEGRRR